MWPWFLYHVTVHFISIKPVLSDNLSYVTIFHCSLGRSQDRFDWFCSSKTLFKVWLICEFRFIQGSDSTDFTIYIKYCFRFVFTTIFMECMMNCLNSCDLILACNQHLALMVISVQLLKLLFLKSQVVCNIKHVTLSQTLFLLSPLLTVKHPCVMFVW